MSQEGLGNLEFSSISGHTRISTMGIERTPPREQERQVGTRTLQMCAFHWSNTKRHRPLGFHSPSGLSLA